MVYDRNNGNGSGSSGGPGGVPFLTEVGGRNFLEAFFKSEDIKEFIALGEIEDPDDLSDFVDVFAKCKECHMDNQLYEYLLLYLGKCAIKGRRAHELILAHSMLGEHRDTMLKKEREYESNRSKEKERL